MSNEKKTNKQEDINEEENNEEVLDEEQVEDNENEKEMEENNEEEKEEENKEEDLSEEEEDYKQKYLRAIADYQNLSRQNVKEKAEFAKFAINEFLQEILPVYDHLKLSIKSLNEEEEKSPWVEGVKHVLKQFKEILKNHGVEEIKTTGEKFDHNLMEALEGEGDIVKKEVMTGYTLNGKVIRVAKVIVGNNEEK